MAIEKVVGVEKVVLKEEIKGAPAEKITQAEKVIPKETVNFGDDDEKADRVINDDPNVVSKFEE